MTMAAARRPSVECIATEVHGCLKADGAWLEKCLVTHLENLIAPGFTLIRVTVTLFACVCVQINPILPLKMFLAPPSPFEFFRGVDHISLGSERPPKGSRSGPVPCGIYRVTAEFRVTFFFANVFLMI